MEKELEGRSPICYLASYTFISRLGSKEGVYRMFKALILRRDIDKIRRYRQDKVDINFLNYVFSFANIWLFQLKLNKLNATFIDSLITDI